MLITFTKRFEYKEPSGLVTYPSGATLPVTEDVAIAAALKGATDTPEALDLADKSKAKSASEKSFAKMKRAELLEEVIRLNNQGEVAALEIKIAQLETELQTAQAQIALSGTVDMANEAAMNDLITAWNAASPEASEVDDLASITAILTEMAAADDLQEDDDLNQDDETDVKISDGATSDDPKSDGPTSDASIQPNTEA